MQDALLKALQQWPYSGVPQNPGGWLFRVARNGALDVLRRNAAFAARAHEIAAELHARPRPREPSDSAIEDDELRMVFMCCHPSLPPDARVALSLKTVGGFSVAEIARAFLSSEPTIAQRLVRAKRLLREQRVGLELPHGADLVARTDSVLEVDLPPLQRRLQRARRRRSDPAGPLRRSAPPGTPGRAVAASRGRRRGGRSHRGACASWR